MARRAFQHGMRNEAGVGRAVLRVEPEGLGAGRRSDLPRAIAGPMRPLDLLEDPGAFGAATCRAIVDSESRCGRSYHLPWPLREVLPCRSHLSDVHDIPRLEVIRCGENHHVAIALPSGDRVGLCDRGDVGVTI